VTYSDEEMLLLAQKWLDGPEHEDHPFKQWRREDGTLHPACLMADWKQRYNLIVGFFLKRKIIHAGMGSDLMALCGKMEGISGYDQVKLSYANEQVTCPKCLQLIIKELKHGNEGTA
jgi:hypothetical protein